ncbi:Acg family FMN-binding oxidoreductase [Ectothiorhodospira mobilis]|uniref:Acg family FMN-binding oxidoreductase n=1 Tax=Ectothiorhodospira mobilis TaxID=195064 RepID=UPI001907F0E1|nr:nitroreductase family protein [Ectothiorhodospira mobilis]MBK1693046.1 hypothetical protein [Ectothiorhodospira mobilis]
MKYSDKVGDIWCHKAFNKANPDYSVLVHYATLAASSHNTQPWIFRLKPNRIQILPDFSRRCPEVDPDDHHLYASLGCAAENLLLASKYFGLQGRCGYDESTSGVQIDFEETGSVRSPLFEAILKRHCSRVGYDGEPLSSEQLQQLEEAGQGEGVAVMILTEKEQKEQVAAYVAKGNRAQFSDPAWSQELKSWIRFNLREAVKTGDGLYGPVMGRPNVPRWLGKLVMRFGLSAEKQNEKDYRHILSSSAIAVVFSDADDKAHWITAGRCCQHLALQAAALGLKTAFINQPVEVASLRPEFARFLRIGNRRPDLVMRIGHGPEMPRSLRRPVEDVIG